MFAVGAEVFRADRRTECGSEYNSRSQQILLACRKPAYSVGEKYFVTNICNKDITLHFTPLL